MKTALVTGATDGIGLETARGLLIESFIAEAIEKLEHEPLRYASLRLIAQGAVDALLWVASSDAEAAPPDIDDPAERARMRRSRAINGFGAAMTGVVLAIVLILLLRPPAPSTRGTA